MILADYEIKALAEAGMIAPFELAMVRTVNDARVISYGVGSFGYDMRLDTKFKVFDNLAYRMQRLSDMPVIDPKRFDERILADVETDVLVLPPFGSALGCSVEYWRLPRDVTGLCIGKSTYARSFVNVYITPMEAGWEGILAIEIVNHAPYPVKVYAHEGIAQVLFFRGNAPETAYGERNGGGKYQGQRGITLAKV